MHKRRFQNVAVFMGGPGAEREVSLQTGSAILSALKESGYDAVGLDLRNLHFSLPEGVQAVYVAVHGEMGEDGMLQWELEQRGIPFTGSRSHEMQRSIDKEVAKALLDAHGLPNAAWEMIDADGTPTLEGPLVFKAPRQGSSIGVAIAMDPSEWDAAIHQVRPYADRILVETFVPGSECTVSFLGKDPLPIVEIRPQDGRYDFEAKYERGDTNYLCPASYDPEKTAEIMALARKAFAVLGGRHVGRVDFRVTDEGKPAILELNPIPGCTATSLLPKAALAAGIAFPQLCAAIMEMAEV